MGKGGGGAQPAPKYRSLDGMTFDDPNAASDRDRQLQLAAAFGFDRTQYGDASGLDSWLQSAAPDVRTNYQRYNNEGLTAADYRSEERLRQQEQQSQQAEADRKAAIAAGRGVVDTGFSGFDDNYFGSLANTVLNYYQPQLDQQFGEAQKQLKFKLARQNLLQSDTASKAFADLTGKYNVQKAGIASQAADAARSARENVSSAKSQLYSYADAAADPAEVNQRLGQETSRIRSYQPELTPLGQVFTDYLSPIVNQIGAGIAAESQGYRGFNTGLFNNSGRNSSVNVQRSGS